MTKYLDAPDFDFSSSQMATDYDQNSSWSPYFGELIFRNLPLRKNLCVLDVGCGTGYPCIELSQRLGSSSHVYGIDIWQAGLERAQQKVDHFKINNVTLLNQNASSMSFSDEKFDLIVCNVGINNFESSSDVFRECQRTLKPSGLMAMTSNPVGHMSEFYEFFAATLNHLGLECYVPELVKHIEHRQRLELIRAELQEAGFEVQRVLNDSFSWRFLNGTAFLNTFHIVYGFLPGWKNIVSGKHRVEVFRDLEQRINTFSESAGEFVVTIPMHYIEAGKAG